MCSERNTYDDVGLLALQSSILDEDIIYYILQLHLQLST
jgi:hypothetical protein